MIRLLVVTTLFPNSVQPRHGIFVETRLRHLLLSGKVAAEVIAPVPWFPFTHERFGQYANFAKIPKLEQRGGCTVHHPRYLIIPKIGMLLTPLTLAISIWNHIRRLRRNGANFDLIDGHYYYPDGVAIALISKWLDKPFTITARGTDINLIPNASLPRKMILWAAKKATASITVCQALKTKMVELGAEEQKIYVMRNGVDLELFKPKDRGFCRRKFGITKTTLLSVGHLVDLKGHDLIIKAMVLLPDLELLIVGEGKRESYLREIVDGLSLRNRVRFCGSMNQSDLSDIYNAADILVLASSREGWANVLLESMACGTPVAASNICGTPEVVASEAAGELFEPRTPEAIAAAVSRLLSRQSDRAVTRQYAERFSWEETTSSLIALFSKEIKDACFKSKSGFA